MSAGGLSMDVDLHFGTWFAATETAYGVNNAFTFMGVDPFTTPAARMIGPRTPTRGLPHQVSSARAV